MMKKKGTKLRATEEGARGRHEGTKGNRYSSLFTLHTSLPRPQRGWGTNWLVRLGRTLLGLQCKATVLVVALLVMLAGSLCGVAGRHVWAMTSRLDREHTRHQAGRIARLTAPMLADGDRLGVQHLVDEFMEGGRLLFLSITDRQGEVVASAARTGTADWGFAGGRDRGGAPVGFPVARQLRGTQEHYFDVRYPIAQKVLPAKQTAAERRRLLGYVQLGLSRNHTIAEFDAAADLVAGIAIAIVLMTIPLGFLVVRTIVVPLEEMSRVAQRFSLGDATARCKVKRSDEIGILAADLNMMADEVVRKHDEITTLNAELERRVSERTAQLRELASRDPLTGLYNRRHIGEVLTRRFSEAKRYKNDLSMMMIDMDDFKSVNDRFGHQVGDELLMVAATTISNQLRSSDVAARFGGDEFIVVLPQSSSDHAQSLGERVQIGFQRAVQEELPQINTSLSVGIASLAEACPSTDEEFVRAADQALYEAKELGRNRIIVSGNIGNKVGFPDEYHSRAAPALHRGACRSTDLTIDGSS